MLQLVRHDVRGSVRDPGGAVQVDPIKPKLTLPGTWRFRLNYDVLLSTSAFKFDLRRYIPVTAGRRVGHLKRCGSCPAHGPCAQYCGTGCQRADWVARHRGECAEARGLRQAAGTEV